jgi:hypothetical protein
MTMLDLFGDNGYATYHGTATLNIPQGLTEFYVLLADAGSSGYMGYTSLDVDAELRFGTGSGPTMVSPPVDIFMTEDNETGIEISSGVPAFDIDMSSWGALMSSVYAITGYYGGVGQADVQYETGSGPLFYGNINSDQYVMVGRGANGNTAAVVFKFVTQSGYKTAAGGTINADVYFNGTPSSQGGNMWLGINDSFQTGGGFQNISNVNDFTKSTAAAIFNSSTYGNHEGSTSLAIPEGLREFYVVLADAGSSGRFALKSLSVDAQLTGDPNNCYVDMPGDINNDCNVNTDDLEALASSWLDSPGPWAVDGSDWSTIPLTLWGLWGSDLEVLTYLWSDQSVNELAFSGSVLLHPAFGDPNAITAEYETAVIDAVAAGNALGMNNFMMRLRMGTATSGWSTTSWTDTTEWANAMTTVQQTAQLAADAGIGTLMIDVENYTSGTYLFETSDAGEIAAAYNRGLEIGNALKATNPDMRIILMPEFFAGVFWGGGSSGIMDSANSFRNGLMKAGLGGGVLVATEGTYGNGAGNTNVNEIDVRYNGAYTAYSDPEQAKTAFIDYINTVAAQCRAETDSDNLDYWDNYCGIAAGSWVLGTDGTYSGKRSAWFTPELFEAQLQAFQDAGVKQIWTYGPNMPYIQFGTAEVTSLGYPTGNSGGSYTNPAETAMRYYLQYTMHPAIDEYVNVLQQYGNYSTKDINTDSEVSLEDLALMAQDWGKCENINCP